MTSNLYSLQTLARSCWSTILLQTTTFTWEFQSDVIQSGRVIGHPPRISSSFLASISSSPKAKNGQSILRQLLFPASSECGTTTCLKVSWTTNTVKVQDTGGKFVRLSVFVSPTLCFFSSRLFVCLSVCLSVNLPPLSLSLTLSLSLSLSRCLPSTFDAPNPPFAHANRR